MTSDLKNDILSIIDNVLNPTEKWDEFDCEYYYGKALKLIKKLISDDKQEYGSIKCYNCKCEFGYELSDIVGGAFVICPDCGGELCILD